MIRFCCLFLLVALILPLGFAGAQEFPIMDKLADRVVQKYQNSSCRELAQKKSRPPNRQDIRPTRCQPRELAALFIKPGCAATRPGYSGSGGVVGAGNGRQRRPRRLKSLKMPHSKALRAIGQSLEMIRIDAFELQNQGQSYLVRSRSITQTSHWMLASTLIETGWDASNPDAKNSALKGGEGWLRYEPPILSRLDAEGRKKRQNHVSQRAPGANKPSQDLRTLGEHLDRIEASAFTISWNPPDAVTVQYQTADGEHEQRSFSFEKLQQLGMHMRFRRSTRSA